MGQKEVTDERVALLKQQSKALSKRKTFRRTVRPAAEATALAMAQLREGSSFFLCPSSLPHLFLLFQTTISTRSTLRRGVVFARWFR